jgi:CheY-like chemotaxis protein
MSSFRSQPKGDASHKYASQVKSREAFYEGAAAGLTALIVDDNPVNRFALTALLQRGGMTVLEAVDGAHALETVIHTPDIDIVLMDIMMPIMDGYETMTAIRNRPKCRDLPIIAVTAKEADGERQRCIAAGASDYIPKPINAADLFQAITCWLPATPSQPEPQPPLVDVQAASPSSQMNATRPQRCSSSTTHTAERRALGHVLQRDLRNRDGG